MSKHARLSLIILFVWLIVVSVSFVQSVAALESDALAVDQSGDARLRDEKKSYIIKSGDIIDIIVEGYEEDYNQTVLIQPNGSAKYPPLGNMPAAGLTVSQFESTLKEGLQIYISEPQAIASVRLKEHIIQSGDVLTIVVEEHTDYDEIMAVQPDGHITYTPLGEIQAAGLTVSQLEGLVMDGLKTKIGAAQVKISTIQEKISEAEKTATEILKPEAEKIEEIELEKKGFLIKPGDIIDIVVAERGDYGQTVMVQPDGNIEYLQLGDIPAASFTENRLSQEIAAGLSSYMSNPQVMVAITGTVEFDPGDDERTDEVAEYLIGPRDVIRISVRDRSNYDGIAVVQPNGEVSYSPLGQVQAAGLTPSQLTENIRQWLSRHIDSPEVDIYIGRSKSIPEGLQRIDVAPPASPRKFGHDFFIGARHRILKLEEELADSAGALPAPSKVRDAISGFVGPVDMMSASVAATIPSKYVLGPGDKLTLRLWSDVVELQTIFLVVNDEGEVMVPRAGRMVVHGMTLAQFQEAAREELTRVAYRDLKLTATLDKLRSIQISIAGEAFRPGGYAVSAVTTLFNAIYMCGGPTHRGSLREIKLLRGNETRTIDFYSFLTDGDSSQNFSLDAGDTILIPQIGKTGAISGEVKRSAIYELKKDENLLELISLAGGVRASGFLQRVQIDSVDPSKERIVVDVDLTTSDQPNPPIFDGDTVTVFSIPSERMNVVTLEGKVRMPGVYQLKDGMKVSDLIRAARGLLGEAYREKADLLRLNDDQKTTKLIPINLSKARAGGSDDNINLKQWDRLIVYSKWDVKWEAERVVSIHGAVQRPGSYQRSGNMTIADLLVQSGGALPTAYLERAFLIRLDKRGEATKGIHVDLRGAGETLELKDGDALLVYTYQEARWVPRREVTIEGAIQNPGAFPRVDDMKVSHLIQRAGGLLPDAYPDRALLLRLNDRRQISEGFSINTVLALQDDPKNNLYLKDGDKLLIYTYEEAAWEPERKVTIAGAVLSPNVFQRVDGMRVSDLLRRSGGTLPNAYLERADITRFLPDHETYENIPVNLARALSGDEAADILLQDEDLITVYTIKEVQYRPENTVILVGMAQRPGTYVRTIGMSLSDLLFASGGPLPGAHKNVEIARISDGDVVTLAADASALMAGDKSKDILLEDEDVVFIRQQKEFMNTLRIVTLVGEVKYPGSYTLEHNERLNALIRRAGGLTDRAYPEAAVVTRKIDYLALNEQRKSIHQVSKLFDSLTQQEYQRELAKAALKEIARKADEDRKSSSAEQSVPISSTNTPVVSSAREAVQIAAITSIPGQAETAVSAIEEMTLSQSTMVTPARKITSFLPSGRLIVDLKKAMKRPGSEDDIIVEEGDTILIPIMSTNISVSGAVIQPSSLAYVKGKKVDHYIKMVGGYSRDADCEGVYVVKANGMVIDADKAKLSPGDIIVVPTKVMVQKVTDRWAQVIGLVKFTVTTAAMVYSIRLIVKNL